MKNSTREKFDAYLEDVGEINGVSSSTVLGGKQFAVDPTIEQGLDDIQREEAGFLSRVNLIEVDEQQGETLGLDITGPIAGNTDTTANDREANDVSELSKINDYHCQQTNSDTALRYAKLDQWAKFDGFEDRIGRAIAKQKARDRLMIGFNGISRAANSNKTANPLLQDVAKGWLQKYRENSSERVLTEGATAGEIRLGQGGDYNNLDAMVLDMVNEMVDVWHQEDNDLIVIIGRELFNDKFFGLVNSYNAPTERNALDLILSNKMVGNMPAARVPFFPSRGIMVTRPDNLSIYRQAATTRRTIVDNVKRDRIEDYSSVNEDFVIEDYGLGCMAESASIKLLQPDDSWA